MKDLSIAFIKNILPPFLYRDVINSYNVDQCETIEQQCSIPHLLLVKNPTSHEWIQVSWYEFCSRLRFNQCLECTSKNSNKTL